MAFERIKQFKLTTLNGRKIGFLSSAISTVILIGSYENNLISKYLREQNQDCTEHMKKVFKTNVIHLFTC